MFEKRGWSRSKARDYYDLLQVLDTYREQMDLNDSAALWPIRNVLLGASTLEGRRAYPTPGCSPTLEILWSSGSARCCRRFLPPRR